MIVTMQSLEKIDSHWADKAIGEDVRDRVLRIADAKLVRRAVGGQVHIDFTESSEDAEAVTRLVLAYELAAIEGLRAFLSPIADESNKDLISQCASGAWRAYEIKRLEKIPRQTEERILHVLHLSALAYCGDRWADLRRWYSENDDLLNAPSVAGVEWDRRLLFRLYDCWIRLFRKNRWDDLDQIREIIAGLREDQKQYEKQVLNGGDNQRDKSMALRLVALYHLAKATELLALYMMQGEPADIETQLDKHFEHVVEAASTSHDSQLDMLGRWLHAGSRRMVVGSIWKVARSVNSRVSRFVQSVTKTRSMFELLPPQRIAIQEQGLLDQASTAVVIEMPTSGGKTLLAQFRMLQALNQFDADKGWVAYVAPTRALTAQITRRLRRDFDPLGIRVEQLTGAVEIDAFEEDILSGDDLDDVFDILVATPEKLQLVLRNSKISRPLALIVMDEAQKIEDENRGMRIELLLATIKREHPSSNFLLLMPFVEKADRLARWLAPESGKTISIGTTAWKPNERIVGIYRAEGVDEPRGGWTMKFETLVTTPKTIHLDGIHTVGTIKPLPTTFSKVKNSLSLQTGAMAKVMSERGTSIAVATRIDWVWNMARKIASSLEPYPETPDEISLLQRFLATEISPDFELIEMLKRGVAVHHAGLSDETRSLIEWLAEEGILRVLCATTTIVEGINFPVSSVFLSSRFVPSDSVMKEMTPRDFWNLAGRAGRLDHDSVGVVGLAAGNKPDEIREYVSRSTGELISQLVTQLDKIEQVGQLNNLISIIHNEQWASFRCYVAHLLNEKNNLDEVLSETEQLLRNTYGYGLLRSRSVEDTKAKALLAATKEYARQISDHPENAKFADATGFAPEGVRTALLGLNQLERKLTSSDWTAQSLFGERAGGLADLFGVMLHVPELSRQLSELGGQGLGRKQIAEMTNAWVSGETIQGIARQFFKGESTNAITTACKAIYRNLVNNGSWGLSALSKMPTAGIDYDTLSEEDRRHINLLPAMIYHGVRSAEAVLLRMNNIPRSIAENLGSVYRKSIDDNQKRNRVGVARQFLKDLEIRDWSRARPEYSRMSGSDYKDVWKILSGEGR